MILEEIGYYSFGRTVKSKGKKQQEKAMDYLEAVSLTV